MGDASSIRKATTLPVATGTYASGVRYSGDKLYYSNGTAWKQVTVSTDLSSALTSYAAKSDVEEKIVSLAASPATALLYTATSAVTVTAVKYAHATKETTTATLTAKITKDAPADAAGAGVDVTGAFTCTSTINVVQTGVLSTTAANLTLSKGDKLSIKYSGSVNEVADVTLTIATIPAVETIVTLTDVAVPTTGAGAASNIFIADRAYTVIGLSEKHGTKGTNGSAVTAQLLKVTGTTAPASGTTLMSSTFNLKGTDNTVQYATLSATSSVLALAAGDRIAWKVAGDTTALATPTVSIRLLPA